MTFPLPYGRASRAEAREADNAALRDSLWRDALKAGRPLVAWSEWLDAIGEDFDFDTVTQGEIDLQTEVAAWLDTAPQRIKAAFLAHTLAERRRRLQIDPHWTEPAMTLFGIRFPSMGERV